MYYDYLIVGAGFAGSVLAEILASQHNKKILVVEKRKHIAGNAYDEYDENGILIHKYGPHIFHTNDQKVFEYLSRFTSLCFYEHKVFANLSGELFHLPINRTTINKLYNKKFSTDYEVQQFLNSVKVKRSQILNSEDIIVTKVGYELFEKFFKYYTKKQWGLEPRDLPPSICGRIPVRTNDDDRYFTSKYQFMPEHGYTKMFENILYNKNIEVVLNTDYKLIVNDVKFNKMIFTGAIDYFYDYKHGRLPYRSIKFEYETIPVEYYQLCAQVNYTGKEVDYTRVVEHKYLSNQKSNCTTISREYPQTEGEPFYPIPTETNMEVYKKYKAESLKLNSVFFCGRLAEYKYYNMDQVIADCFRIIKTMK